MDSRALLELKAVVAEFKEHYTRYAEKNRKFIRIEDQVDHAIQKARAEENIKRSAEIFGAEIAAVMRVTDEKQKRSKEMWKGRVGSFLTKVYPVVRLSLQLTSAIAEVSSLQLNVF